MKLLIVTQVIDTDHPILGFFHRWVAEFALHYEHVHVIALQVGKHDLPANVTVHSLGKESGANRLQYLIRFYQLIWQLRPQYDHVFVHMNQIYIILGAALWRATGKRVGLWYMHGTTSVSLRVAEKLTHRIFTGSPESCRIKSSKIVVTGHGIDTTRFISDQSILKDLDLITVGRITHSKNLLELVDMLALLRETADATLAIVGVPVTTAEHMYDQTLREHIETLGLSDYVYFPGRVDQTVLPQLLNRAKVFVSMAQNGSLDKAILEPMALGLPVISMAPGSASLPLGKQQVISSADFIRQVQKVLESGVFMIPSHSQYIQKEHSITSLIPKLLQSYV